MDGKYDLIRTALRCKKITNVLEEYEWLASFFSCVSSQESGVQLRDPIFDSQRTFAYSVKDLLSVSEKCDGVWMVREGIDWLLFYLFHRRYGWDDWMKASDPVQVFTPSMSQRTRTASKEEEQRYKDRIVSMASNVITWFEKSPLLLASLKSMNSALRIAKCAQTTRQHMSKHAIRWLSAKLTPAASGSLHDRRLSLMPRRGSMTPNSPFLPEDASPESMFMAVKDLVVICMTDSVFTIRTGCIQPVAKLLDRLSLNTVLHLLDQTIETCKGDFSEHWETAEGLLNVLGLLIKRAVPYADVESQGDSSVLLLPAVTMLTPPTTMTTETYLNQIHPKIQALVFRLFEHTHPSVRIGAVNLFITCLKRCPQSVVENALNEVMNEVCMATETSVALNTGDLEKTGLHTTESLLSLCELLLRFAGSVILPPSTGNLQNTLIKFYLGHPETNVRMAACQVYVTLILGSLENQNRVRYLFNRILEDWQLKSELLLAPLQKTSAGMVNGGKPVGTNPATVDPGPLAIAHEARLSIFGLISHTLVQRHYALLYSILVRGLNESQSDDVVSEEASFFETRVQRNNSTKSHSSSSRHGSLPEKRASIELRRAFGSEDIGSPTSRSNSSDSYITSPKPSATKLLSGLTFKKNRTNNLSVLERLRKADESLKFGKLDYPRPSVWKGDWARRFSFATIKQDNERKNLFGLQPEGKQTNLPKLFFSMLHAASEYLVAEPRDLRQCARKTIPELVRLLFWFNASLSTEFIFTNLSIPPNLESYVALKALRTALDEFALYEKLVISGEDYTPPDLSVLSFPDARSKTDPFLDTFPDGYFLNVPLLRILLHPQHSSEWLRPCSAYLTTEGMPTFIVLPSIDCIIVALSLVDRFPQFLQAARYTESQKPTGSSSEQLQLHVDPNLLIEAVTNVVQYLGRMEVILNDQLRATTANGEHLRIGPLRPYSLAPQDGAKSKYTQWSVQCKLVPFLARVIHHLEKVIFHFLPPTPNPDRPCLALRHTAGILLAPCLLNLTTWPLAFLPPKEERVSPPTPGQYELRLLAVRKLLRILASIVHALPPSASSTSNDADGDSAGGPDSLPSQMRNAVQGRIDVTSMANAYFTQLEQIMTQLIAASDPLPLCQSPSWWWFRALCEHVPKFMQIAPHANPVSLLRHLLDEVQKTNTQRSAQTESSKRMKKLWKRAINYAKEEAAKNRAQTSAIWGRTRALDSWALTVGQLMQRSKDDRQVQEMVRSPSPERVKAVEFVLPEPDSLLQEDREAEGDEIVCTNTPNPAFDYISDEGEELVLEAAEPDSSSGEELALLGEIKQRASIVHMARRRKRYSSAHVKARPIEPPPPLPDIVGLVQRVWVHCEPVTVRTLQNLLSGAELSLITGEQVQRQRLPSASRS